MRTMAKLLINLTHGPEAPTRAALGFLVGRAAVDEGHEVTLFLAGDAVQLLREPVLDSLVGLGTGSLRESYDAIVQSGGRIYVSGNSSKARGFEPNGQVRRRCRRGSSSWRSRATASSRIERRSRWAR